MGFKKRIEQLRDLLDKSERKKSAHCERIDMLLDKLEQKKEKLSNNLENEKNPGKRKRLKMDLKIVSLQLKKGAKRRDELKEKCQ